MRERDLIRLEFFQVLEKIKAYAHSKATERYIDQIRPLKDENLLKETISLVEDFMRVADRVVVYNFEDVEPIIKRSTLKDYVISVDEALALLKVIRLIKELRKALGGLVQSYKSLASLTRGLYLFSQLESAIESVIDPRGFVKDSASESLREIRQKIRDTEKEVIKRLEAVFSRPDAERIFSDRFVAYKNGRYVLPVKTTEVKKIVGVVHGTSSSGFTTYVEPQSVIELNNRLTVLREEEEEEVRRILRRLASIIGEQAHRLMEAFRTLVKVDYLKALSEFSKIYDGRFPAVGNYIELVEVKHPLLVFLKEDVVPVDIVMKEKRGLVLTGPNTGGKTVALKTLGLCSLLFQSGIPIPIKEGTLPVFENVFVDIGDEQSIEQSLSTFSSHMTNIAEFLPQVNGKTLVLLDELGAGTDPVEGSALGIALLEHLKEKNAFVLVSTHHTPIKLYALSSDYYTPASVLFDRESLKPLYRIAYGAVGESMAFTVAIRCGIPLELIQKAKDFLPAGSEEFFSARETLETCIRDYHEKLRELQEEKDRLQGLIRKYEDMLLQLEKSKREEIRKAVEEIRQRFEEFLQEAERQLKSVKDRQKLRELFRDKIEKVYAESITEKIEVGDWVDVFGSRGKVVEIREDRACVLSGGVKAWVKLSELKKTEPPPAETVPVRVFEIKKGSSSEINLTGFTVGEALAKLELFLQEAYSMGLKTVKVIHGYGILKKAVQEYLSSSPLVVFHREGYPKEGGAGTSLVYLKRD